MTTDLDRLLATLTAAHGPLMAPQTVAKLLILSQDALRQQLRRGSIVLRQVKLGRRIRYATSDVARMIAGATQ